MPAVRPLRPGELNACAEVAAEAFGFSDRDLIPAWLMHTTNCYGGIALGAFDGDVLVGFSYAVPGFDGAPFLLSCGLAVRESHQGRGLAYALKLAQAEAARAAGYRMIRWTTGALASRPLRLYLTKLGGRLVRYRANLYDEVRPVPRPDEVEIEWALVPGPCPCAGEKRRVEIPWDGGADASRWVEPVRSQMTALLRRGHVGTEVDLDEARRRSFVIFEPANP